MRRRIVAALFAGLAACGQPDGPPRVTLVFAAASLAAPFQDLEATFEREHPGCAIETNLAGTPQLVMQLREGAAADVFASADEISMQRVVDGGMAVGEPRAFARNHLAIVVRTGNPLGIAGLSDLARKDLRIALCGPEVPAGRYARAALAKAGVVVKSLSDEPNVKALVGKVWLGEVDAALAYATDARHDGVEAVPVAAEHDVIASYPIVVLGTGRSRSDGGLFVDFVLSARGRQVLAEHGFSSP